MATSGDRYLATSGDFFMATDTGSDNWSLYILWADDNRWRLDVLELR